MAFVQYNANPEGLRVGDCTIRAISKATGKDWATTYAQIALEGFMMCDMPSANAVWSSYLRRQGFRRHIIPDELPPDYTVEDFCKDHPEGTYLLALQNHVVCVIDGDYYDSWQSGGEFPIFYWSREDE